MDQPASPQGGSLFFFGCYVGPVKAKIQDWLMSVSFGRDVTVDS